MILSGNFLFFYASPLPAGAPAPKRVACVDGAETELAADRGGGGAAGAGGAHAHAFEVRLRGGGGVLTLAAASAAEASRWVAAITNADYARCVRGAAAAAACAPAPSFFSAFMYIFRRPPAACTSAWPRR